MNQASTTYQTQSPGVATAAPRLASALSPIPAHLNRPHAVRLSSHPLGWGALNIERREESHAGREFLPAGTIEHLIFIRLNDQYVLRESHGETTEGEYVAGQISIYPAGIPIRWEWRSRLEFLMLTLSPSYLDAVARRTFGPDAAPVELWHDDGRHDPLVNNVASALLRECLAVDAGTPTFVEGLANVLCVHLIRHYNRGAPEAHEAVHAHRGVTAAVRFIRQNFAQPITLADIAAAASISPFHLTRLFKKTLGMSPYQYLLEVRVHGANALLSIGADAPTLAEVATAVGFSDQSHLTRQFKRVLGITPKQARR
ncbi:MAG: helix-turn-helix transcriptional regulator [Burkholderiales bacterium]|nr:helix-turn-helix transcriptional regulator [Burkholderiales bacterium]